VLARKHKARRKKAFQAQMQESIISKEKSFITFFIRGIFVFNQKFLNRSEIFVIKQQLKRKVTRILHACI
jgi:hypothetical protein